MTIEDLSRKLDKVITTYEEEAGAACNYCDNEYTGNAMAASHNATAKALSSFKAEILTFLSSQV